jgi:peptide/nickel transport system permease protein
MTVADAAVSPAESRTRRRIPILMAVCGAVFLLVVLCAAVGKQIAPHDPNAQDLLTGIVGPRSSHLLGTDTLGRDVLSRVIVGARTAIIGPALIVLGSLLLGGTLGLLAGFKGGRTDWIIMRWVDVMYALPALLVAIVVIGVLGGGYFLAVGVLALLSAPYDTRVIRAATLEQRPLPYVEAARTLGLSNRAIMFRHIGPNVAPIIVANSCLNFAFALVSLAALSFLGLGVGPATPDWGRMLYDNRDLITENAAAVLAPAIILVATAACLNLLGDQIYERLSDRGRLRWTPLSRRRPETLIQDLCSRPESCGFGVNCTVGANSLSMVSTSRFRLANQSGLSANPAAANR